MVCIMCAMSPLGKIDPVCAPARPLRSWPPCAIWLSPSFIAAAPLRSWQWQNGRGQLSSKQWRGVTKRHALFFVRRDHDFSRFSHRRAGLVSGGNILFCRLSILPDSDSCLGLLRRVQSLCCSNDRALWAELPGDDDRLDPRISGWPGVRCADPGTQPAQITHHGVHSTGWSCGRAGGDPDHAGTVHVVGLQYGVAVALVKASWFWSIVAIVLAVGGFLAQLRTMQEYTLVWAERQVPGGASNVCYHRAMRTTNVPAQLGDMMDINDTVQCRGS